jgi:hypothetical protein
VEGFRDETPITPFWQLLSPANIPDSELMLNCELSPVSKSADQTTCPEVTPVDCEEEVLKELELLLDELELEVLVDGLPPSTTLTSSRYM